ncbi:MAG: hypothetical protein DMG76_29295 [Acidobacteria bacterium]|nr:MAG: hypothetical protein DMG76_29295 [Acidobacteriota bacterium]
MCHATRTSGLFRGQTASAGDGVNGLGFFQMIPVILVHDKSPSVPQIRGQQLWSSRFDLFRAMPR